MKVPDITWIMGYKKMTLNEFINRLEELRQEFGDLEVGVLQKHIHEPHDISIFDIPLVEITNVVKVDNHHKTSWVCLMNGNTSQIVTIS